MQLEQLLSHYGLWGVGAGAGLEGETATVLGGVLVHRGLLSFLPTVLAAALGSFLADQIFFGLGRRFRDTAYVQKARHRPAFARALAFFERHPVGFVFAFRFLYGLRTITPLAIGTTNFPAAQFAAINAAAALLWGALFVSVGYFFGQAIEGLFGTARLAEIIGATLAAAIVAAWFVRRALARRLLARTSRLLD